MLTFTKGDYKVFAIQFPVSVGDLTGCTVFFTAKRAEDIETANPTDSNAVIKAQEGDHDHPQADAANSKTVMTVEPDDITGPVGEYLCDFQIVDANGRPRTYKKANGDLLDCRITPEATQRTS